MKAIVYRRYGSPDELHPEEVPKPAIIEDDDVVVKVHAVSVNAYDWRLLRGSPFLARLYAGLIRPRYPILGADISGCVNGYHPLSSYRRALKPGGVYVMCGGSNAQIFQALILGPLMSLGADRKLGSMAAKPNRNDLALVIDLVKEGKIRPVIDKRYSIDSVPEAVRYLEEGHAAGKVVISVCD